MLRSAGLVFLLALGPGLHAQEGYRLEDLGLAFAHPGEPWTRVGPADAAGGGREYEFLHGGDDERSISLIVWQLERYPSLRSLCPSELRQMGARGDVDELLRDERTVGGLEARAVRYRFDSETDGALVIDATYFRTDLFLGRLAVTLPRAELEGLDAIVRDSIEGLRIGEPAPVPVGFDDPVPTNVLTVVHGHAGEELALAYLEALPGAARANGGEPVVIAVGDSIDRSARAFLRKYRPGEIRLIGPPHPELSGAREAVDDWPAGGTVVVSEADLGAAVQAACLAVRLDAPLLVDRGDLARRVLALRPARVLALGAVTVPTHEATVERLSGPADVARIAGGADYIALCNVAEGRGRETAALAAVLAAIRGGVVLPFERPIERHRIPLERTDECPPGLEDVAGTGDYLVARFDAAGEEVLVGAAQTTVVRVASDASPRYGRLRIDLDGDGRLAEDEEPRIGSVVTLGGRSYHLTYHYGHAFVGYLKAEILLDEVDPRAIQAEVRDLAAELGTAEFLAIVGTPGRIPFHYEEATGYFEAYDIKQELPSDAPYANLDEDAYLELAVGRLPVEDLFGGSAAVATTVAYERLAEADWSGRATMIQPGFHELEGALPWVLPNAEALIRGIESDLEVAGVEATGFYRDEVEMDAVLAAMRGSAWIAYFNHSGPGTWGVHPGASIVTGPTRRTSDRSLPELDGAPIVFGGGCSSAALDVGQPLALTFPGRFFELGAVGYLGNTRVAYARSEHLVQLFFARLASGESTLGQAYRDSRNFLAHLLDNGHLVGPLDEGLELGVRDFLRGQYRILNLFGDPALRPRLPQANGGPIEVDLAGTGRPGHLRLTVTNHGQDRRDVVQMMPASGQGEPREFFVRTGPGMTSSHLPHEFVGEGLAPVRSVPEIQPGAWVDVELPPGAHDVRVTLASGPRFADRGFTVLPGARGEPRLQMYVPLVRSTLEKGDGSVAEQVAFDVAFQRTDGNAAAGEVPRQSVARVQVDEPWSPQRSGGTRVDPDARETLERVQQRHGRVLADGRSAREWRIDNPQPRFYGEAAHFVGSWDERGRSRVEARELPPHLLPRAGEITKAVREVADLPFASPLPPLAGMHVRLESKGVLVLTPLAENEGDERIEVHVRRNGTVKRIVARQFDLTEETRFTWRETGHGPVLSGCTRRDPVRPEKEIEYRVDYEERDGVLLPQRITLEIEGMLPRPAHFDFTYGEHF